MTRLLEKEPSDPSHSFWSNHKSRVFRLTRSDENRHTLTPLLATQPTLRLGDLHALASPLLIGRTRTRRCRCRPRWVVCRPLTSIRIRNRQLRPRLSCDHAPRPLEVGDCHAWLCRGRNPLDLSRTHAILRASDVHARC